MLGPNVDDGYYACLLSTRQTDMVLAIGSVIFQTSFLFFQHFHGFTFFFKFFDASEIGFGAYEFRIGQLIFLFVFL